jgi:hypothetical protein
VKGSTAFDPCMSSCTIFSNTDDCDPVPILILHTKPEPNSKLQGPPHSLRPNRPLRNFFCSRTPQETHLRPGHHRQK